MDKLDFSEEEIREQLEILGYKNIPKHKLQEFKQDLDELIQHGDWKSLASPTQINSTKSQPSPPAYTKEKVSRCHFEQSGDGFFLQAGQTSHDRHVQQPGRCDSYAQHSVGVKLQRPPAAPRRLQVEAEPGPGMWEEPVTWAESGAGPVTWAEPDDSYTSSSDSHERRFIRRKVLRKHKGQTLVCDESVYSEDSDVESFLEQRLAALCVSPEDPRACHSDGSHTQAGSTSTSHSYTRGMTRAHSDGDIRPKPKSFIRPVMSQHKTIKKSDPVAKYFQYKQLWDMFKLPGEKERRSLRWEIREQLAYQAPPPKPRRVPTANTYTVPTEKKRSALRWEVRNDLANGLLPHRFTYRF